MAANTETLAGVQLYTPFMLEPMHPPKRQRPKVGDRPDALDLYSVWKLVARFAEYGTSQSGGVYSGVARLHLIPIVTLHFWCYWG